MGLLANERGLQMSNCSISILTSHDEPGTVYTVRYHRRDNHVPTSVDFHEWGTAMGFACKMMTLSLDDIALHARNERKDDYYAHN